MTRDRSVPSRRSAAVHAVLRFVPLVAAALTVPRLLHHLGVRDISFGMEVGESPLVAPVACAPGAPVQVELRKPPYRAEERVATCRPDGLVQLSIVLGR